MFSAVITIICLAQHSVPRAQKHATQHHDAHTEQVHKAEKTRAGSTDSGSDLDAVKLSHGENTGKAEAQRRKHATPEGSKFQPGQKGEQVRKSFSLQCERSICVF